MIAMAKRLFISKFIARLAAANSQIIGQARTAARAHNRAAPATTGIDTV